MSRIKVTTAATRNRASDESGLSIRITPGGEGKRDVHLNSLRPMVIEEGEKGIRLKSRVSGQLYF